MMYCLITSRSKIIQSIEFCITIVVFVSEPYLVPS